MSSNLEEKKKRLNEISKVVAGFEPTSDEENNAQNKLSPQEQQKVRNLSLIKNIQIIRLKNAKGRVGSGNHKRFVNL